MKRALNICWIAALLSGTALWIQAAESVGTKGAIRGEPIRPLRPAMTNDLGSSPRPMVITTNLAPILTNRAQLLLTLAPPAPAPITTNAAGFIELGKEDRVFRLDTEDQASCRDMDKQLPWLL